MAPERNLATRLVRTPARCGGRPRVAGTGVTVRRLVGWSTLGCSPEDSADACGPLRLAQGDAALRSDQAKRAESEGEVAVEAQEAARLEREQAQATRLAP